MFSTSLFFAASALFVSFACIAPREFRAFLFAPVLGYVACAPPPCSRYASHLSCRGVSSHVFLPLVFGRAPRPATRGCDGGGHSDTGPVEGPRSSTAAPKSTHSSAFEIKGKA